MPKIPGKQTEPRIFERPPQAQVSRPATATSQVLQSLGEQGQKLGIKLLADQKQLADVTYASNRSIDDLIETQNIVKDEFTKFKASEDEVAQMSAGGPASASQNIRTRLENLFHDGQSAAPSGTAQRLYKAKVERDFKQTILEAENEERRLVSTFAMQSLAKKKNNLEQVIIDNPTLDFTISSFYKVQDSIKLLTPLIGEEQARNNIEALRKDMRQTYLRGLATKAIDDTSKISDALIFLQDTPQSFKYGLDEAATTDEDPNPGAINPQPIIEVDDLGNAIKEVTFTPDADPNPKLTKTAREELLEGMDGKEKADWIATFRSIAKKNGTFKIAEINRRSAEVLDALLNDPLPQTPEQHAEQSRMVNGLIQRILAAPLDKIGSEAASRALAPVLIGEEAQITINAMWLNDKDDWPLLQKRFLDNIESRFKAISSEPRFKDLGLKNIAKNARSIAETELAKVAKIIDEEREKDFGLHMHKLYPAMFGGVQGMQGRSRGQAIDADSLPESLLSRINTPSGYNQYIMEQHKAQKDLFAEGNVINVLPKFLAQKEASLLSSRLPARDRAAATLDLRRRAGSQSAYNLARLSLLRHGLISRKTYEIMHPNNADDPQLIEQMFANEGQSGAIEEQFKFVQNADGSDINSRNAMKKAIAEESDDRVKVLNDMRSLGQSSQIAQSYIDNATDIAMQLRVANDDLSDSEVIDKALDASFPFDAINVGGDVVGYSRDKPASNKPIAKKFMEYHKTVQGLTRLNIKVPSVWPDTDDPNDIRNQAKGKDRTRLFYEDLVRGKLMWRTGDERYSSARMVYRQSNGSDVVLRLGNGKPAEFSYDYMVKDNFTIELLNEDKKQSLQGFFNNVLDTVGEFLNPKESEKVKKQREKQKKEFEKNLPEEVRKRRQEREKRRKDTVDRLKQIQRSGGGF